MKLFVALLIGVFVVCSHSNADLEVDEQALEVKLPAIEVRIDNLANDFVLRWGDIIVSAYNFKIASLESLEKMRHNPDFYRFSSLKIREELQNGISMFFCKTKI